MPFLYFLFISCFYIFFFFYIYISLSNVHRVRSVRCALSPLFVSSLVHVSVHVFISLSCVIFPCPMCAPCPSCPLCALCTVSTCSGIHCFVFSLCCVSVVCVMCSGVQVVVVCCDSVEGVVCVLHVVIVCSGCCFCYCMCVCAACEKRSFFPLQEIYIKKCIFFEK